MHSPWQINNTNITNNENTVKSKEYGDVRKCNIPVDVVNSGNTDNPETLDSTGITDKLDKPDRQDKPANQYKTENANDKNDGVRITGNFTETYYGTSILG